MEAIDLSPAAAKYTAAIDSPPSPSEHRMVNPSVIKQQQKLLMMQNGGAAAAASAANGHHFKAANGNGHNGLKNGNSYVNVAATAAAANGATNGQRPYFQHSNNDATDGNKTISCENALSFYLKLTKAYRIRFEKSLKIGNSLINYYRNLWNCILYNHVFVSFL